MLKTKRGLLLFGHPIHSMVIHFPFGLWSISFIWDFLGILNEDLVWWKLSFWSIAAGLVFALLSFITGVIDFSNIPRNHPAEKVAIHHMIFVVIATLLFTCSFFLRIGHIAPSAIRLIGVVTCSLLGLILLMFGSWYGGELIFRCNIGTNQRHNQQTHHVKYKEYRKKK
ncbi:Uncharacterized membrane protein [Seinonella peptonophila]|uniref:Uncharacterized membrane protein n=1 Tax=Seinonella peptonophila TaxID=112248 RepID=A0A1M5AEK4_9BACL|nr:DUF2231 domain-containing protein [Seinonella peptonophila]SHF28718.1 Uncharacterized membrane protein [Seinonella peptonophila]